MAKNNDTYQVTDADIIYSEYMKARYLYGNCTRLHALLLNGNGKFYVPEITVTRKAHKPMRYGIVNLYRTNRPSKENNNATMQRNGTWSSVNFMVSATSTIILDGYNTGAYFSIYNSNGSINHKALNWLSVMLPKEPKLIALFANITSLADAATIWKKILNEYGYKYFIIEQLPDGYYSSIDSKKTALSWRVLDVSEPMAVTTGRSVTTNKATYVEAQMITNAPNVQNGLFENYKTFKLPKGSEWIYSDTELSDVPSTIWVKITSAVSVENMVAEPEQADQKKAFPWILAATIASQLI